MNKPEISYDEARGLWLLDEPFSFVDPGFILNAEAGFQFDLASVPRILWSVIAPFELSVSGALVHDLLYRFAGSPPGCERTFSRWDTDCLFLRLMAQDGVPKLKRWAAFLAVRAFGFMAWGGK